MRAIHLMAVELPGGGRETVSLLPRLASGLANAFGVSCYQEHSFLDPAFAHDTRRRQFYSTALLARMAASWSDNPAALLAVTSLDLYVPILTYVFGEAQIRGSCAIVSTHRLEDDFYGLPPDPRKLEERLLKEAIHELGHTRGLRHCPDYTCAMASTHSIEYLDLKMPAFCRDCFRALD